MKNGSIFDVQNIALLKMCYHKKKFNQLIIFRLNTDMVPKIFIEFVMINSNTINRLGNRID